MDVFTNLPKNVRQFPPRGEEPKQAMSETPAVADEHQENAEAIAFDTLMNTAPNTETQAESAAPNTETQPESTTPNVETQPEPTASDVETQPEQDTHDAETQPEQDAPDAEAQPEAVEESTQIVEVTAESEDEVAPVDSTEDELDVTSFDPQMPMPFRSVIVPDTAVNDTAHGYSGDIETRSSIADTSMLLEYIIDTERKHGITMSFPLTGVDPQVFSDALQTQSEEYAELTADRLIALHHGDEEDIYELIVVDDVAYLSCISRTLNQSYLDSVITEVAEALYMHGEYIYTLVGPRQLSGTPVEFIETLKLNTYEMSILCRKFGDSSGISIVSGTHKGRAALRFEVVYDAE